jgi:hypothetical protein
MGRTTTSGAGNFRRSKQGADSAIKVLTTAMIKLDNKERAFFMNRITNLSQAWYNPRIEKRESIGYNALHRVQSYGLTHNNPRATFSYGAIERQHSVTNLAPLSKVSGRGNSHYPVLAGYCTQRYWRKERRKGCICRMFVYQCSFTSSVGVKRNHLGNLPLIHVTLIRLQANL